MAREQPVKFAREVLQLKRLPNEPQPGQPSYNPITDWEMDEWQIELIEAAFDVYRHKLGKRTKFNHEGKPQITCRACQGPGKTFGIAILAHIFGFAFNELVIPVMAPKKAHVKTRFFGEFNKIAGRALPGYAALLDINAEHVYWHGLPRTNHFLLAETGQQPENIQGLRRSNILALVDESSGVSERLFPVIEGNLSGSDFAVLVLIGNPTRNQGTFASSHLKETLEQDYYRMHIGPAKSRRIKQAWIDRMERKYGKGSPVVKVRCYGEFAADDENQLIALEWIVNARARECDPIIGDGSLPRLRVSVDCGAGGTGETVCTAVRRFNTIRVGLRQTRNVYQLATASHKTADEAERLFYLFSGRKGTDDFVVDSLGVGVGAAGELIARGHNVVTYQGGAGSDNPVLWRNRRTQSYLNARDDLRDGGVALLETFFEDISDWDDFDAQMCAIRSRPGTERLEDLMTKKEMQEQGIASPDMADSWAMQYATQTPVMVTDAMGGLPQEEREVRVVRSQVWENF